MICEGIDRTRPHIVLCTAGRGSPQIHTTHNDAALIIQLALLIRMHHNNRELNFVLLPEIPQKCGSPFIYSLFVDSRLGVVVVELGELTGPDRVHWDFIRSNRHSLVGHLPGLMQRRDKIFGL